jgi:hypothetical protein
MHLMGISHAAAQRRKESLVASQKSSVAPLRRRVRII